MSDFECRNNHIMRSGDAFCRECGEPKKYMDGVSRERDEEMELMGFPGECDE